MQKTDKHALSVRGLALVLSCAVLAPAAAQPAGPWTPAGATACDFGAWTQDAKPAIRVHAAPAADAAVVGSLPTTRNDADADYYSVNFQVHEARAGWLRISDANDDDSAGDHTRPRPVYRGTGWIRSDDARIGIQSARGYARPDSASARLLDLGDDWLTDRGTIRHIVACQAPWVLLDYEIDRGTGMQRLPEAQRTRGRAWFRGVCSNAVTTCDMRSVDN
ncbi:hypothetical protein CEK29_17660 [Bordetella genomosp. 5]|uniref:hypothetical protein n=1 Tax=Bordetella genomosp. 5 TaxID=1395608 RepID=UPI000B9E3338|nr:hypothetical protein [Bordetella genomosp. 5]OZI39969.1 hypothetical protein CEK29_17660 [Bordetella genomosp. 5]